MADTKITALTALTAADPINDVIPIVDVSDTSMAASGTTKKISVNNLLSSSPTASGALTVTGLVTAGSATITGALTVDTTTLVVDVANDRVGIGTATPVARLIVRDGANRNLLVASDASHLGSTGIAIGSFTDNAADWAPLSLVAKTSIAFGLNGTTAMTLNATGLGVGTSPANGIKLSSFVTSDGAPATSGTTQASGSLRIGAVSTAGTMDMGTAGTYSWIQVLDRTNLATNYNLVLNPNGGNLLVGTTTASAGVVFKVTGAVADAKSFEVYGSSSGINPAFYCNGSGTVNGVATGATNAGLVVVNKDTGNLRSISAAGSINASGADYAEYMTKSGDFVIAKGDVAGIDANGNLTNVFADAVSFVVKSTDPSYVGNDKWGVDLEGNALESARQLVDRIAFAGQVPVNVIGATAGDYIVPVVDGTGIKGISVSNPTFEQYKIAVGKVITIDTDGRARIIVKLA